MFPARPPAPAAVGFLPLAIGYAHTSPATSEPSVGDATRPSAPASVPPASPPPAPGVAPALPQPPHTTTGTS